MAEADNQGIPAVFVDKFVEVVPATPGKQGLLCAMKTLPKCMRLVEENAPITFKFELSHIGLTYVRDTYPWLDIDPVSNQLHARSIEADLRRWSTGIQELFEHCAQQNSGSGGYCKNGGCYKCGPHVITIAALRSVSVGKSAWGQTVLMVRRGQKCRQWMSNALLTVCKSLRW